MISNNRCLTLIRAALPKKTLTTILMASIFLNLTLLIVPILIQIIFDKVIPYDATYTFTLIIVLLAIICLLDFITRIARGYLINYLARDVENKINTTVFEHALTLPFWFHQQKTPALFIQDLQEIEQIRLFLLKRLPETLINLVAISILLPLLFLFHTHLASVVLLISVIGGIYVYFKVMPLQKLMQEMYQHNSNKIHFINESVRLIKIIKYLRIEKLRQKLWREVIAKCQAINLKVEDQILWSQANIQLLEKIMGILIIGIGALDIMVGKLSVGTFIAFQLLCQTHLNRGMIRLAEFLNEFSRLKIAMQKLNHILQEPCDDFTPNKNCSTSFQGNIDFKQVSFTYPNRQHSCLNNLNFSIKQKEKILIAGKSGIGKSTLINLLTGLYSPTTGSILYDGLPLSANNHLIRDHIAIVPQENSLFKGTIRENISLRNINATCKEIQNAAKLAEIDDFIKTLPLAYDTTIESMQEAFSQGQKQRLAIARALLIPAVIYIFDEATNALDANTEAKIWRNIQDACQHATVIIITHKINLLLLPDKILHIDNQTIYCHHTPAQITSFLQAYVADKDECVNL